MKYFPIAVLLLVALSLHSYAADWPKFLGPNQNDIVKEEAGFTPDLKQWEKAWESKIGIGYSAISISGKLAFTLGHDGKETETLYCIHADTGKEVWTHSYKGLLISNLHFGGPNATPTIDGDNIYSISKDGKLFCLNKADGKVIWQKNLLTVLNIKLPNFGFACSPVVDKENVYLTCGKAVSLNKNTGAVNWVSEIVDKGEASYHPGHATPVVFDHSSKTYILLLVGTGLEVLNIKDGSRVARHNLKAAYNMTATTPIVFDKGSKIIISWNKYSEMLNFDGKALTKGWKTSKFAHSMQNSVLYGKVLYGTHGIEKAKRTALIAIDAVSGEFLWEEAKFNWAQITGIGDTLLCMGVSGDLSTVKASEKGFEEISRIKILDNVCWTKATYANNNIYVRNDKGRLICLKIK